jgi:hypothetical protein
VSSPNFFLNLPYSGGSRCLSKEGNADGLFRWIFAVHAPYHGLWSIVVGELAF